MQDPSISQLIICQNLCSFKLSNGQVYYNSIKSEYTLDSMHDNFPYLSVELVELGITSVDVPLILLYFDVHLIDVMGVCTAPLPDH